MSFLTPTRHAQRTRDAASHHPVNIAPLRTPGTVSHSHANSASSRTPEAVSYRPSPPRIPSTVSYSHAYSAPPQAPGTVSHSHTNFAPSRTPEVASHRHAPRQTAGTVLYPQTNSAFPRTPEAASYSPPNHAPPRTPDAWTYRPVPPASLTPDTTSYHKANLTPLQTNESSHLVSFPSTAQPVLPSHSYHRSRVVSSMTQVQRQTSSAAPRVDGSGKAPPSGRSRTVSSGPSMRSSAPSTGMDPSPSATIGYRMDDKLAKSTQRHTTGNQIDQAAKPKVIHPLVHQAPAAIQQHPMSNDMGLIAAVTAARGDHREFPWYPVWVIAIKDWMFANSHTATVACNIAPQYVLEQWYKTDTTAKLKKTWVIPDFAQVLQYLQTSKNGTRILARQKVILIVENKPELPRKRFLDIEDDPFESVLKQARQQATFAFIADTSLLVIGAIIAFGARWKYIEFDRPRTKHLKAGIKKEEDMTFGEEKIQLIQEVPKELVQLSPLGDETFELLDHMGRSAQALEIIARRIKSRECQMWHLA
ncbi:hypothetical protein M405DRAFT_863195 [Rhizopogon salebrosus TDB-379]|nr:hypothetical protein M405DRAFT_863195 [Rhizopogon salebrosus TDB-379]